jgi:hypothetical protein
VCVCVAEGEAGMLISTPQCTFREKGKACTYEKYNCDRCFFLCVDSLFRPLPPADGSRQPQAESQRLCTFAVHARGSFGLTSTTLHAPNVFLFLYLFCVVIYFFCCFPVRLCITAAAATPLSFFATLDSLQVQTQR